MTEEKLNLNHVIDSLLENSRQKELALAYKDALLKSREEKIKELEEELDQLRTEHIKQMDEDVNKDANKKEEKKNG